MKYSFVLVALFLALVYQCSARPQPQMDLPSSDAPTIPSGDQDAPSVDIGTGSTEATVSGDQVVFDETQANQGDAEAAGVTTDMPSSDDESQDGADATTVAPSSDDAGDEGVAPSASVLKVEEVVPAAVGEMGTDDMNANAGPAPSDDSESETMNTTPTSADE